MRHQKKKSQYVVVRACVSLRRWCDAAPGASTGGTVFSFLISRVYMPAGGEDDGGAAVGSSGAAKASGTTSPSNFEGWSACSTSAEPTTCSAWRSHHACRRCCGWRREGSRRRRAATVSSAAASVPGHDVVCEIFLRSSAVGAWISTRLMRSSRIGFTLRRR